MASAERRCRAASVGDVSEDEDWARRAASVGEPLDDDDCASRLPALPTAAVVAMRN
jgi:hypothetical protein